MFSINLGPDLLGRRNECRVLDRLVDDVRTDRSRVLVLRGEAGVGKTALLDYIEVCASGCRVVRGAGVESEMELPFAGLHQLFAPMLGRAEALPGPQRDALATAFGLVAGPVADRFLVGLAVLSLLSEVAEKQPVVCLVDDAQWLDTASAEVLAFVARRLLAESVALVFVVREPSADRLFDGLPERTVGGLSDADSRRLLEWASPGRLDQSVRDRIVAETRGNPLALLELPRGMTAEELAGGFARPDARPLASQIEQSFLRRIQSLPSETRRLLLIASAEPVGDITLLWRAAGLLGIEQGAATPAQDAGLIDLDARVRFRHPLVRAAAYRAGDLLDRQAAHRALAEVTDLDVDPDRRAWHRAHAAVGVDESVADELERSADRAQARGGVAAAAAFLERATELTPDPARRGSRALAAAQAKLEAGAPEAAEALLVSAELSPLDDLQLARVQRLRAQIAFARTRGGDAAPLLLAAAKRLVPLDAALARETCLEALAAAIHAGRFVGADDVVAVARGTARSGSIPMEPSDLLLDGLATHVADGYAAGVAPLRRALTAYRQDDGTHHDSSRWLWLACRIAADLFDYETWDVLAARGVRMARETGTLDVLPMAASYLAGLHLHAGDYTTAATLMAESSAITEMTGTAPLMATTPLLAAYRGDEESALELIELCRQEAMERGQSRALSMVGCAHAVLLNSLGRYGDAVAVAEQACEFDELSLYALSLVELVEAAARGKDRRRAVAALERLAGRTSATATDWALGVEARCRALVTEGSSAAQLFEESIERLSGGRLAPHLARSQLVYGEWLRRENRRMEARLQLRSAHDTFSRIGADAFARRARRELAAMGEMVAKRSGPRRDALTPQELQIARLAADGCTNPEIGSQLFISPRTVEYHLHKVFAKLRVASRRELRTAMPNLDRLGLAE